ncbi:MULTISPECIES: DUF6357 family protein [unclassified Brachybacterium]|uniref:DUF6357 family protein n=1 Tax=unclassified Brachybacterium TaxID=2623841 RepID=UPI003F8DA3F2
MNFTWFATSFDTDDWLYRVLTIVQMGGVLVLASGVRPAFVDHDFRVIVLAYVVMRLALVAQWLRASRGAGSARRTALVIAVLAVREGIEAWQGDACCAASDGNDRRGADSAHRRRRRMGVSTRRAKDPRMTDTVFVRSTRWLPWVRRTEEDGLELVLVGGADATHDPREFPLPIQEEHLAVLREDLPRHVLLAALMQPLYDDAGIRDPLDARAASALLRTVLLGSPAQIDALAAGAQQVDSYLIGHGADAEALARGELFRAARGVTESVDHARRAEHDAARRRAGRGIVLGPLDTAILDYTGQRLHGGGVPRRLPDAVEPSMLPTVLEVIAEVEAACEGMQIRRDPRRGATGTDKQDWRRIEAATEAALVRLHPELSAATVRSLCALVGGEAADRGEGRPFDEEDLPVGGERVRELVFSDAEGTEERWRPGGVRAAEAFWQFVARNVGRANEVFSLEDPTHLEEIHLHFYADGIERIIAPTGRVEDGLEEEYGIVGGLAEYRELVRSFIEGGYAALDAQGPWLPDTDAFVAAVRRHRAGEGGLTLERR